VTFPGSPTSIDGVVVGAKFPYAAGGLRGTNPGGVGGGCDNRAPKRLSLVGARDGDVDSPACRAVGKRRTVGEHESGGILEEGVTWSCRLGQVDLGLLPRGKPLNIGVDADGTKFCFFQR